MTALVFKGIHMCSQDYLSLYLVAYFFNLYNMEIFLVIKHLLNIFVETFDSLMNRKFKRTTFL